MNKRNHFVKIISIWSISIRIFPIFLFFFTISLGFGKSSSVEDEFIEVGIAKVDITPETPIRLAGYSSREVESDVILRPLYAKALVLGKDDQDPLVLITVDLIGITRHLTDQLFERLALKTGLDVSGWVVSVSHTHGSPEMGNLLNHYGRPLPPDQLGRIINYHKQLLDKLENLVMNALKSRRPASLSWGQGEISFGKNRRVIKDGKWINFGVSPDSPVDSSFPLMRINEPDGKLRAVFMNYACHGTTLKELNQVHGDWIGEAQKGIEEEYQGVTALVAVGCGGDINPNPRGELKHFEKYGEMVVEETKRLLGVKLKPLKSRPKALYKSIELPYSYIPDSEELVEQAKLDNPKGYYAKITLDRLARGQQIPTSQSYPITTWSFGKDLAMVFLAGEVVVDYSLRLKKELSESSLWINAYSNDVPSYIPSRRVLMEGGYEAEASQYSYNQPAPYSKDIEDIIINTVFELLPNFNKR